MKYIHAKIEDKVMEKLHEYRIKVLGRKATVSDTIKYLLNIK